VAEAVLAALEREGIEVRGVSSGERRDHQERAREIATSVGLILLLSPDAAQSKHCLEEVTFACEIGVELHPVVLTLGFEANLDAGMAMILRR